jgi:hypothetical protein
LISCTDETNGVVTASSSTALFGSMTRAKPAAAIIAKPSAVQPLTTPAASMRAINAGSGMLP